MKKVFLILVTIGMLASCSSQSGQNESKSVNENAASQASGFQGVYKGITPCADCPGIYTVVQFSPDAAFYEHQTYLERKSDFADSGKYVRKDSLLMVKYAGGNDRFFKIENDSTLRLLNGDTQVVTGSIGALFVLKKADTLLHK